MTNPVPIKPGAMRRLKFAAYCDLDVQTIDRAIDRGELIAYKVGRAVIIDTASGAAWLAARRKAVVGG
jgi:hypothetical protein